MKAEQCAGWLEDASCLQVRPRPRAPAQLRNGGLRAYPANKPPSNYTIRGADGRKHAYQLPASVDHGEHWAA